ncbi:MAG: hypothetical protein HC896_02180 [Bacteroidales bacterium]|nr:hypothetical protein [Bacteroidales bacterium]
MEAYLGMGTYVDTLGLRGTDQGTQLKIGGATGFNAQLSGYRENNGLFNNYNIIGGYWTATPGIESPSTHALRRNFVSTEAGIDRQENSRSYSYSIRCVKD